MILVIKQPTGNKQIDQTCDSITVPAANVLLELNFRPNPSKILPERRGQRSGATAASNWSADTKIRWHKYQGRVRAIGVAPWIDTEEMRLQPTVAPTPQLINAALFRFNNLCAAAFNWDILGWDRTGLREKEQWYKSKKKRRKKAKNHQFELLWQILFRHFV